MDSRFVYNPESGDTYAGILEIHVHHARNIHNICIYEKQDVYAKFSLTYNPDETISTKIVTGGGRNPDFNDDLIINVNQPDAVLKCEIWMLSRAKNFMDDQLLGFVLVPLSSLSGKGSLTQDFNLSSTDLFHSPAGTIKLSLYLNAKTPTSPVFSDSPPHSSTTSQFLLDKDAAEDYCRIEFPDANVVDQNQRMVSEYFVANGAPVRPWDGSFLHLAPAVEDYEMVGNSSCSVSPDQNSGFMSSTVTSFSDDHDSREKKAVVFADNASSSSSSKKNEKGVEENEVDDEVVKKVKVKVEAEESAMQQQIVEMYMRSMQQFTESLAKMKLPIELDKRATEESIEDKIEIENNNNDNNNNKKKDGCRVFYGSRAFF